MGNEWATPHLPQLLSDNMNNMRDEMRAAGISNTLISDWVLGSAPIGIEVNEFLVPSHVIGIFRTRDAGNYLLKLRRCYGSLRLSYLLLSLISPKLQVRAQKKCFRTEPQRQKEKAKVARAKGKERERVRVNLAGATTKGVAAVLNDWLPPPPTVTTK